MTTKFTFSRKTAFIVCTCILAVSAIGKRTLINTLQIYLQKEPIYLKAPLDNINESKLGSYTVAKKSKIENQDIVEELGTNDYLMWELEDKSVPEASNVRYCSLFITYYTGINDRIPHVPEECYFGAGNRVKEMLDEEFDLKQMSGTNKIGYRRLVFTSRAEDIWGSGSEFSVSYLLRVNGKYAAGRTAARNVMATNLLGKYSYFSKVEWRFNGKYGMPDSKELGTASSKLLETILPVLEEDHWPNIVE